MKNYKKYISEIKRLDIKPMKRFPELSHFRVKKNKSPEELENLMIYALADLALLPSEAIIRELTAVQQIGKEFSDIDTNYPVLFQKFQNGNLDIRDLKFKLRPLLKFVRPEPELITVRFMVGLYISILNKHNSIITFKNRIQNLLEDRSFCRDRQENFSG